MSWNSSGPGDNPNPWGSSGGSGQGGQRPPPGGGPWGSGGPQRPGGPGPGRPSGNSPIPDIDQLIGQLQATVRRFMGGGGRGGGSGGSGGRFPNGRGLMLLGLGAVALWLASGLYRVQPDELGVVLRFGAYAYRTQPGLNWHLPWPIESVELPKVTRINRTEIGYRTGSQGTAEVPAESLMLTGDENIIDINVAIFWKIDNAVDYLFNVRTPDALVKAVAESSLREVIGRTPIQPALTQARAQIETDVMKQTQQIMNRYQAGIEITQVQLQKVDPPAAVVESFRDVQRANTDAERMRNEAEAYRNDIVPRARGDAAQIVAAAQGEKQAAIAQATGEGQRFDSVLKAYQAAKEVTLKRMYIDTMRDILMHAQTLVVDDKLKGLVPFLPLDAPGAKAVPQPAPEKPASSPPEQSMLSQPEQPVQPTDNGQ